MGFLLLIADSFTWIWTAVYDAATFPFAERETHTTPEWMTWTLLGLLTAAAGVLVWVLTRG